MGSPGSCSGDCEVGSIVWVRRRNGSWWPGKILGPDELSSSHLTSPRSGTPVKLLGREDASVDWYNLEKSKRVKAFRCGEFDDCIERAESSQGMPIKKREKYARREDAILHALELEKQQLMKQGDSKPDGGLREGAYPSLEHMKSDDVKVGCPKSHQLSKSSDTIRNTEIVSAEDDQSVIPRMRGLQDIGLKISSSKRKVSSSVPTNGSETPLVDNDALALSPGSHTIEVEANGMGAIYCAKRSKCVYFPAESNNSLDSKEIPPSQMEMPASQLGIGSCNSYHTALIEENASGFTEDSESDSSGSDSSDSETDSDSSRTERDTDYEMETFSGVVPTEVQPSGFRRTGLQENVNMSSEEPDDSGLSGDMSQLYPLDPVSASESVSKWQLKGKRNIRNLAKRSTFDGAYPQLRVGQMAAEKSFQSMIGLEEEYYLAPRSTSIDRSIIGRNPIDWEDLAWEEGQPHPQGFWDVKGERFHHFHGQMRSMLVDVDLKVEARYKKEPVPIVSLMSKLNGMAVIGHPIQIQALEDGLSETLLSNIGNGAVDSDGYSKLPPAWRTARRTAKSRVPRPHLSSVLDGDEASYDPPFLVDQERKVNFKKSSWKGLHQMPRPPDERKFLRKTPKKVSFSSSQKTRTLSSIAVDQNFSNKLLHDNNNGCQLDGLMKSESTTVACIPVKLVFSRLLEKINRPPSKAASNVALLNTDADRNLR